MIAIAVRARSVRKAVKKAEVEQLSFTEVRAVTTYEEQERWRRLSEPMLGGVADTRDRLARVVVRPVAGGGRGGGGGGGRGVDDRQRHCSSEEEEEDDDCSFDQNRSSVNIHDIYSDELNNQIKYNLGDFLRSCQRGSFCGPLSPSIRYFSYDKGPAAMLSDNALKPRGRDATAREDQDGMPFNLYINEHLFVDAAAAVIVLGSTEDGSIASPTSEDSPGDIIEGPMDRHHVDGDHRGDSYHDDGDHGDSDHVDNGNHGEDRGKGVTSMDPDNSDGIGSSIHGKDETPCNNDVGTDGRNDDDAAVIDERNDDDGAAAAVVQEEDKEGDRIAEGDVDRIAAVAGMEEVEGDDDDRIPEELLQVDVDFELPTMVQQLVPYRPAALSTSDLLNLAPTAAGAGDTTAAAGSEAAALQPYLNYRRKRVKEKLQHLESIDKDDYGDDGDGGGGGVGPQSMRETTQRAVRGGGDLGATKKKYVWERGSGANYFDSEHAGSKVPLKSSSSSGATGGAGHDRLDLEQQPRRPLTFILPAAPVDVDEQWSGPYSYYSDHRHSIHGSSSSSLSPSKMKKAKEIYDEIELHNLSIYSATKSRARRAALTSKYFEYSTHISTEENKAEDSSSIPTAAAEEELSAFEPSTHEEINVVESPMDIISLSNKSSLQRNSASKSGAVAAASSSTSSSSSSSSSFRSRSSSEKRKDRSNQHHHAVTGQVGGGGSSLRRSSIIEINGKLATDDGTSSIHAGKNSRIDSRSNSGSTMVARSNRRSTSAKTDHTANNSRRSLWTGISQPVESGMRGLRLRVDDDGSGGGGGRKAKAKAKDTDLLLIVQQLRASVTT